MTYDPTVTKASVSSREEEAPPAGVVHNSFALVRALSRAQRPVSVTALASVVGIPKTTAHRLLEQMAQEGIVTRCDHKWALRPGFGYLMRAGERPSALTVLARPRLHAMAQATGASLFLHRESDDTLETVCCSYAPHVGRIMPPSEQRRAALHPASTIWLALDSGQLAAEYQEVRPECNCIATPISLPSGGTAVLALARPNELEVESLKRPLERVASRILSEERRTGV
ncbi:helix-turn-helix domain-containing protein [Streptomyces sp. NRRL S-813]|uniref:helix-turn-helix domain-containing protein n=1 Tax=Streptomyces sp. NRRL S-813 TaxID=1463919 RepID=UPI0004C0172C|nr:helix-turn-helix domain-containing protein [Streptomyces sp. NRRL S-813]